ncbi:tyrosine-protein phosphatase [Robiginitalea sp. SC105]|uniref:tyrosine-protein phosphatase n=1 Tax=Robiginitalea sp. SC105 TaxID=2762332 RepID=UPI00163A8ADD|nr:CpsB/CapC family capsule biosynthesis tyrosine phosphatase [Robiginitalea sp. SC105]MBC2840343.1 histidinol phosphatase [Robiginitalea sp. SC105]
MFSFFEKKRYLVDHLEDFVDIHNHILPGIDDGAADLEASLGLVREFGELGIHRFIATPHILQPLHPNNRETIEAAHDQLMDALMDHKMNDVAVEPAAEHMIDDTFELLLKEDGVMPLRNRYLLVEMSYLQPSLNFDECIVEISRKGFTPILAHPERYMYLHKQKGHYRKYAQKGTLFQLNFLSLGDYYGSEVQKMAFELLDEELVDFVASDAHGIKHLHALKEIRLSRKRMQQVEIVIQHTIEAFY